VVRAGMDGGLYTSLVGWSVCSQPIDA
jgi:hypothetical protein